MFSYRPTTTSNPSKLRTNPSKEFRTNPSKGLGRILRRLLRPLFCVECREPRRARDARRRRADADVRPIRRRVPKVRAERLGDVRVSVLGGRAPKVRVLRRRTANRTGPTFGFGSGSVRSPFGCVRGGFFGFGKRLHRRVVPEGTDLVREVFVAPLERAAEARDGGVARKPRLDGAQRALGRLVPRAERLRPPRLEIREPGSNVNRDERGPVR